MVPGHWPGQTQTRAEEALGCPAARRRPRGQGGPQATGDGPARGLGARERRPGWPGRTMDGPGPSGRGGGALRQMLLGRARGEMNLNAVRSPPPLHTPATPGVPQG